jgi:formylmethanofuran dehydrogenase subunit E
MNTNRIHKNVVVDKLPALLKASAERHHHLCPRQVLGVCMGLLAGRCWVWSCHKLTSAISAATNCWVNHRTMRIADYGKVAATFVASLDGRAIRVAPRPTARGLEVELVPEATNHWGAMLIGYQRLADDALLSVLAVSLTTPVGELISHARHRVSCAVCGEGIINEREVMRGVQILCRRVLDRPITCNGEHLTEFTGFGRGAGRLRG